MNAGFLLPPSAPCRQPGSGPFFLIGISTILIWSAERVTGTDYRVEVVAHSPDFPADPAAMRREFSVPQVNAAGQVLFQAFWCGDYPAAVTFIGRPGSLSEVYRSGDPSPIAGLKFAGGPENTCNWPVRVNYPLPTFNASGEVLFAAGMARIDPEEPLPPLLEFAFWKGGAGNFSLIAGVPSQGVRNDPTRPLPAVELSNAPYNGPGRLQYWPAITAGILRLADSGNGLFAADLEALEFGVFHSVAVRGLITTQPGNQRLMWYKDGPAPGLGDGYVFREQPGLGIAGTMAVGQRSGNLVAKTKVSLLSETDPQDFKTVFYESQNGALVPFYVEGDPLPDMPPPMEVFGSNDPYKFQVDGAQVVDAAGNTLLEVMASSADGAQSRLLGIWKKSPLGLVRAMRYDSDYSVAGGTVRFLGFPISTVLAPGRSAMGDGKIAFITSFSGLGQEFTRGIFRERDDGGFDLIAHEEMVVPGTSFVLGNIPDFAGRPPLLMNEKGEVAFVAGYRPDANTFVRALWVYDRVDALRRVLYNGRVVTIGDTDHTIAEFHLNDDLNPYPPDNALFFNDDGVIVAPVDFTDGTRAILRAAPDGYVDPIPLVGFRFNGAKGDDNWHTKGGVPPTNWEAFDGTPRSSPPGDIDQNTAQVVIPGGFSVVLDSRAAPIGSIQSPGNSTLLTLQNHLSLAEDSVLSNLLMEDAAAVLTSNKATLIQGQFDWRRGLVNGNGSITAGSVLLSTPGDREVSVPLIVRSNATLDGNCTLILDDAILRTEGQFRTGSGRITNKGGVTGVRSFGSLIKSGAGEFSIGVPFDALDPGARPGMNIDAGKFALHDGGSFTGRQNLEIDTGAVLEFAGEFLVDGEVSISGDGALELGTAEQPVDLVLAAGAAVKLNLGGQTARLNGGKLRGRGVIENSGKFVWKEGDFDFDRPIWQGAGFYNKGQVDMENGGESRRLKGLLVNGSFSIGEDFEHVMNQSASIAVEDALIENWSLWRVLDMVNIQGTGSAEFRNRGFVSIELPADGPAGTVDIDIPFENSLGLGSRIYGGIRNGHLNAGRLDEPNPETAVHLRNVANLSDATLSRGGWRVGPNTKLHFPQNIETISFDTSVGLYGGEIPQLKLKANKGSFILENSTYITADLENLHFAHLIVGQASTLTVGGTLTNSGELRCSHEGRIIVDTLLNEQFAVLVNNGIIEVREAADLRGRFSGRAIWIGDLGISGEMSVYSSTGAVSVIGSTIFNGPAKLEIELSGTQPEEFDVLSVSESATLGGTLIVNLIEGFRPAAGDTFAIVQAGSIAGQFANASPGQRIATIDGYGSFVVDYTATSVVLSAFELNPNPPPTAPALMEAPVLGFDGVLELSFSGTPGREYEVESSSDLVDWVSIMSGAVRSDGLLTLEIPHNGELSRFFRAKSR